MRFGRVATACVLALALAGCGQAPAAAPTDDAAASATEDATATTSPTADGDAYGDVGEGTAYFACDEGTTEEGGTPHVAVNPQKLQAQVSVVTEGIPAKETTYVYVDGKEVLSEPMEDGSHTFELRDEQLSDGEHSVEIVQYKDDDPASTPTFYRVGRYFVS